MRPYTCPRSQPSLMNAESISETAGMVLTLVSKVAFSVCRNCELEGAWSQHGVLATSLRKTAQRLLKVCLRPSGSENGRVKL